MSIYGPGRDGDRRSDKLGATVVHFQPIRVEIGREEDGRMRASVPELPEVMAYGGTKEEAVRKVKSIAMPVLADTIASVEELPDPLKVFSTG